MISDEYFWSLYASSALTTGVSEGTAAKMADNMLSEYKKRFKSSFAYTHSSGKTQGAIEDCDKKPWVAKIVDPIEGVPEKV